jgi:hypothetical protein
MVKVTVTHFMSVPLSVRLYTTERLPSERIKVKFYVCGRFTKICQNNPIFSYSQTQIAGIQLKSFVQL